MICWGLHIEEHLTQVLILAALVAVSAGRPRFLVIPLEDVEFQGPAHFPVYRMPPGLARQARAASSAASGGDFGGWL